MKNIENRLKKLEAVIMPSEDQDDVISRMTPEERHRRIAELSYANGSYNGYMFKSLEEYDRMTAKEQTQYIEEVIKIMEPWLQSQEVID